MTVYDILYSSVGSGINTMLVDDHTMSVIDGFLEDRRVYRYLYDASILVMLHQTIGFFSYDAVSNLLHIIIKEDLSDES